MRWTRLGLRHSWHLRGNLRTNAQRHFVKPLREFCHDGTGHGREAPLPRTSVAVDLTEVEQELRRPSGQRHHVGGQANVRRDQFDGGDGLSGQCTSQS
jgi:hypothetical protein